MTATVSRQAPDVIYERPPSPADVLERKRRLEERLRAEFIDGAEEAWRKRTGLQMTAEEVERVLRRCARVMWLIACGAQPIAIATG